jgi:hypothetical protein
VTDANGNLFIGGGSLFKLFRARPPKEYSVAMPNAWRGAALQCGSSIGWQQAAPGNNPGDAFTQRFFPSAA